VSDGVERLLGPVERVKVIARGPSFRKAEQLKKLYGGEKWRKMKGVARIEATSGRIGTAEVHWVECHGVGKFQHKVKRWLK